MNRPRVFLGTLTIVRRKGFLRTIEEWVSPDDESVDEALGGALQELFALAPTSSADPVLDTDLYIDVSIAGYRLGEASVMEVVFWAIPLMWRPRIKLRARLLRLRDRKLVKRFSVTEKPSWLEYINSAFSLRGYFSEDKVFDYRHLDFLLNRASLRLLEKIARAAYG